LRSLGGFRWPGEGDGEAGFDLGLDGEGRSLWGVVVPSAGFGEEVGEGGTDPRPDRKSCLGFSRKYLK